MGDMPSVEGCWDIQGLDAETRLLGALTWEIMDADHAVRNGKLGRRLGLGNGFPYFAMYRCALAHDYSLRRDLADFVGGFAHHYALNGGLRRDAYGEEWVAGAALDILAVDYFHGKPLAPSYVAQMLGVNHVTFAKFRKGLKAILDGALNVYHPMLVEAMEHPDRYR